MSPRVQSVIGMNDVLPAEAARWRALEAAFHATCARYGFGEVRTPFCEYTELFVKGIGEGTDVVSKEMYTFEDRGGRSLTLRPEGTASAVRAYLEHAAGSEPVARWYYCGPMFRGEKPAKGRYRQFSQVGAEVYGDAGFSVDAELIDLAASFLRALGIPKFEVRINSLGSGDTRTRYEEALRAYFTPLRDKLSEDSQRRLEKNPLRIIDSKAPEDQALRPGAPDLIKFLGDDDKKHFDGVCEVLTKLGTPFVVDPTIVRGLDYYTRTIFELKDASGSLGAQDTLAAGGRYDNLVAQLGGKPTPAVGFAMGIERLLLAAPAPKAERAQSVAVIGIGNEAAVCAEALSIARELRSAGIVTHVDTRFGKPDRQFKYADRVGAQAGIVLGSSEVAAGTVVLKDLDVRSDFGAGGDRSQRKELDAKAQRTVPRGEVLAAVRALLGTAAEPK